MNGCLKGHRGGQMRKALPTRGSGPPSGAPCWAVLVTHATTCTKAEGLDGRPSDSRGRNDDHRPPTNREHGGQKSAIPSARKTKAQEGYFIECMLPDGQDNRDHDTDKGL